MIHLKEAVIVEGKYDKITLSNFIDATIIPTCGFSVFKDKEKRELIKVLAEKKGLAVITDSDSAGNMIRAYLKKICPAGSIKNVYIPQIKGKEKRKSQNSKEGFLGVEGMSEEIITEALSKSGVLSEKSIKRNSINKNDLYKAGLSGSTDSAKKRQMFSRFCGLPSGLSSSGFLDGVNAIFEYNEFFEAVEKWQSDVDKK